MANGDAIDKMFGMKPGSAREIFEAVKANTNRLNTCKGPHDFEMTKVHPAMGTPDEYTCRLCRGTVNAREHRWYELGLKHARGAAGA